MHMGMDKDMNMARNLNTAPGLAHETQRLIERADRRIIVGIAGLPGSGKSTLADRLHHALEKIEQGISAVIPMDGFHFTNPTLDAIHMRDRKGAPETFDVAGYLDLLQRLKTQAEGDSPMAFPTYDRAVHEPVWATTARVHASVRIVITEGNYLLLDEPCWLPIYELMDETWWLDTSWEVARSRLLDRHVRGGRSHDDALAHIARNDEPNARRILQHRRPASCIITQV